MYIIKRSGEQVDFDRNRILNAITKANNSVDTKHQMNEDLINDITDNVVGKCYNFNRSLNVEEIQNIVEDQLMEKGSHEVARAYITYRYERALARKKNTTDDDIMLLIENNNEEVNQENSNKNPVINSTQRDYMAGEVSRDLTVRYLLPKDIVEAHKKGIIHFHDSDYFAQHMSNCFCGKTKFITNEGIRPFNSFIDGEQIKVIDKDGFWRDATVHYYGKQQMQIVTLKSLRSTKEIICTPNHRWILSDGSVTTNLSIGDHLYPLQNQDNSHNPLMTKEQAIWFTTGFIIGDGSDYNNDNRVRVRLCGNKIQYANIFKFAGYSQCNYKTIGQDMYFSKSGAFKQNFINSKAWRYLSAEQKKYLFLGYYAADGCIDRNEIDTADDRLIDLIEQTSAFAGYYISSFKQIIHNTNFKENAILYIFKFRKHQNPNNLWIVDSIKLYHYGTLFDAWCVEEPITHSFTLEGGIVTGNCCLINLNDMLQNGTVISGTTIDKPHSFRAACNIATQIDAQVASNQYGGQTLSIAQLAPFVDISRQRIRKDLLEMFPNASKEEIESAVHRKVLKEIADGVQTIQYQLVTLMTTNGQTPFVSLMLYINEYPDEQTQKDTALIIEEILKQRIKGLKNEKGVWITPAFPKLLYVLDENNTYEGSEYYYLTELAAKCTAKRMVPDYISAKIMKQYKGDVYPCMGCVDGASVVKYKLDDIKYADEFVDLWDVLSYAFEVKKQANNKDDYIDTRASSLKIWDSERKDYVQVYGLIRNTQSNWIHFEFSNGISLDTTDDHPFEIVGKGLTLGKDVLLGDEMMTDKDNMCEVTYIKYYTEEKHSYDVTTESEHFTVNGIYSHNCRSFLTPDTMPAKGIGNIARAKDYVEGKNKYYGRLTRVC